MSVSTRKVEVVGGMRDMILTAIELVVAMILTATILYLLSIILDIAFVPTFSILFGVSTLILAVIMVILAIVDVIAIRAFILTMFGSANRRNIV